MADDFAVDSRMKYGEAEWEDTNDFAAFVDALNRGVAVRADGLEGVAELPRENVLDAASLAELKSRLAAYQ